MFTREVLDWREENAGTFFTAKFGSMEDRVWGTADRVVNDGAVVEFG